MDSSRYVCAGRRPPKKGLILTVASSDSFRMVPLFEVSHKETKLNFFELRAAVYVLSLFIQRPVCDRLYSSAAYTMRRSYNAAAHTVRLAYTVQCGPLYGVAPYPV